MDKIIQYVFDQYKRVAPKRRFVKFLLALVPLYLPYFALTLCYFVFRANEAKRIGLLFLIVVNFASIWFILGPILMYSHVKMLKSFCDDKKYPEEINSCFRNNKKGYFICFLKHWMVDSVLLLIVSIIAIIVYPEILTVNMTRGRGDLFFWLDIVFLVWMGIASSCAPAFLSMFSFHILKDIQKKDVFDYNPMDEKHRDAIESMRAFCNRSIAYASSGSVFLPLALFYIFQQPTMAISWNPTFSVSFQTPTNTNPVYILWVVALLTVYAFFTLFFTFYPNIVLSKYIKKKHNELIFSEQKKYIQNRDNDKPYRRSKERLLASAINQYNDYNRLQELKILCKIPVRLDVHLVLSYFSILATILSAVYGIIKILNP